MDSTGDVVLDGIMLEYQRTGDIDVFNSAVTCRFDMRLWDKLGRPKDIQDKTYAVSPWVATMHRTRNRKG